MPDAIRGFVEKQPKLKPCPFCGRLPRVYCWGTKVFSVECEGDYCGISLGNSTTASGAARKWNRRRSEHA